MNEVIVASAITKKFDGKTVLSQVSLAVKKGEILSIIGPSGAGKTTLLRILATLEMQDAGTLLFAGNELRNEETRMQVRRKLGYVGQHAVMLSGTVYDNIALPLRVRGMGGMEIERRVRRVAEMLGISGILEKNARKISGGEAQRTAFARAIVGEPEILFLDEFCANLDYRNIAVLERHVKEFSAHGGTVVLVSHNIFQVRRLAHRCAILVDGRIIACDSLAALEHADNDFVRGFVEGDIPW